MRLGKLGRAMGKAVPCIGLGLIPLRLSKVGAQHDLAYLTKWLQDPASQKPTAHMPKIQLSETEVRARAADLAARR